MSREQTIQRLHDKGFVLLKAHRNNNSPVGWRQPTKEGAKPKYGYVTEMKDPELTRYRKTFNARDLAKSHNGFYLGHGGLCCIDLDTKHSTLETTTDLKDRIVEALGSCVFVETTKSNGWHIYFLYGQRLNNVPRFASKDPDENWIELYYHSRFVACYLSSTNNYHAHHLSMETLGEMGEDQHAKLLEILSPFRAPEEVRVKRDAMPVDEQTFKEASYYVDQIEKEGIDITGGYNTWYALGCSLASAFGTRGFDLFNRISAQGPTYNPDEIEDTYRDWCERDSGRAGDKITIATFFKFCKDAGLTDAATLVLRGGRKNKMSENDSGVEEVSLNITRRMSADTRVLIIVEEFIKSCRILSLDKGSFHTFQDTHWVYTMEKDVMEMVYQFVDQTDYPEPMEVRTLAFWERIVKLLRNKVAVRSIEPVTGDMKEEFNINLLNGVLNINLRTGKRVLKDHAAEYYFTSVVPYEYNAAATCEKFNAFLTSQLPNPEWQQYYIAYIAGCLTKYKLEKILMFVGPPNTGKSTLIDITARVLGRENCTGIDAGTLFSGRPDGMTNVAQMEHKLLAYDPDCGNLKDTNLFKKIATGEEVMGWVMNVSRRMVSNYARLLLSLNNSFWSSFEPAIQKRALVLPFREVVTDINVHLVDEITREECSGILNRLLDEGLAYLIKTRGRILMTQELMTVSRDFHMEKSTAFQWFKAHYVVPTPPDASLLKIGKGSLSYMDKIKQSNRDTKFVTETEEEVDCEWVVTKYSDLLIEYRRWCEDVEFCVPKQAQYFRSDLAALGVTESVFRDGNRIVRGCILGRGRLAPGRPTLKLSRK